MTPPTDRRAPPPPPPPPGEDTEPKEPPSPPEEPAETAEVDTESLKAYVDSLNDGERRALLEILQGREGDMKMTMADFMPSNA